MPLEDMVNATRNESTILMDARQDYSLILTLNLTRESNSNRKCNDIY